MGEGAKRAVVAATLCATAVSVGVGVGMLRRPSSTTPITEQVDACGAASTIAVHVAGWVVAPGVVALPEGSLVADAIDAAGGFRPGANTELINLAAAASAGLQVIVPGPEVNGTGGGAAGDGLIGLNTATSSDLQSLPGVGPVLAERIIAFRTDSGPFRVVEDLLEVPGIGEAKLESIRDLVRP